MSDFVWNDICSRNDTCGLTGAAAFFGGIPGAGVLVNGPVWCYYYALRYLEHADMAMPQRMSVSQPDNNAVVFGAEKFLLETLRQMQQDGFHPDLLLVENSCSMSLIGDDLQGIIQKAALPFPVVTMDSGCLGGGFAEGYAKASLALLEQSHLEKLPVRRGCINVLGLTPFYYNGQADAKEILRLLADCGYQVNAVPGCGSGAASLKELSRAELNVVIHAELGMPLARALQDRFGTPYLCAGAPYGIEGTLAWLQKIRNALPCTMDEPLREARETLAWLTDWSNELSLNWGSPWFESVVVSAPGTTAVCLADTVRMEWLDTGKLVVQCQNDVTLYGLHSSQADTELIAGRDDARAAQMFRYLDNALLLGSSNESALTDRRRNRIAVCNIAFPVKDEALLVSVPFCGLQGARHMAQRIWNAYIQGILRQDGTCGSI